MNYKYFNISDNISLDELKKQYRKLCLQFHPDKGGDKDAFQEINEEYKKILEQIRQKAFQENDMNLYKVINEHLYNVDEYIKKLNVPDAFKPAITYLVEQGVNQLGKVIKQKLK